jgi:hypothetical protein
VRRSPGRRTGVSWSPSSPAPGGRSAPGWTSSRSSSTRSGGSGEPMLPKRLLASLGRLTVRIRTLPSVVVAKVNGAAIGGGCGLACVCDLVVTHADAKLGFPEVDLGSVPRGGRAVAGAQDRGRAGAGRAAAGRGDDRAACPRNRHRGRGLPDRATIWTRRPTRSCTATPRRPRGARGDQVPAQRPRPLTATRPRAPRRRAERRDRRDGDGAGEPRGAAEVTRDELPSGFRTRGRGDGQETDHDDRTPLHPLRQGDHAGICIIELEQPGRPVVVLELELIQRLEARSTRCPGRRGMVLASRASGRSSRGRT